MVDELIEKDLSWLEKAKRIYRDKGILSLFGAGLVKLWRIIFETNSAIWFEKDLTRPIEKIEAKIPLAFVSDSPEKMITWLLSFNQPGLIHPQEIRTGIKEKHHFFYVQASDGQIVGGSKVGYNEVYIVDFEKIVIFPAKTAFWYDTYVLPQKRGLGIATFLICSSLALLKQEGYEKVMCHIPKWNNASIKAFERCGFKRVGYVRFLKLFGFKFTLPDLSKIIR